MPLLLSGYWYVSAAAVAKLKTLRLAADPHLTPDGKAVLVFDARGPSIEPYQDQQTGRIATRIVQRPPALVMQADHGHDLMHAVADQGGSGLRFDRVEFAPEELPDLERLIEYDYLPQSRKDPAVPAGTKLA